jgi:hypothetical protein
MVGRSWPDWFAPSEVPADSHQLLTAGTGNLLAGIAYNLHLVRKSPPAPLTWPTNES